MSIESTHPTLSATAEAQAAIAPAGGRERHLRRAARGLGIAAIATAALVLVSTVTNLALEQSERSSVSAYGHKVHVTGGNLNVYRHGHVGPPIVLLGGLGTAAPALDFAPLIRALGDDNVIVVEGLGYGYSDMTARPRTIENITTELHQVLATLHLAQPYTLIGHSIAGFYTLYYANKYPAEVSAVVGIDNTVPEGKADASAAPSGGINWMQMLSTAGVVRNVTTVVPSLAEPAGNSFTTSERERIRLMTSWNFGNPALADETARIGSNAKELIGMTYPSTLPVLTFLSSESLTTLPHWRELHEDQLKHVQRHQLVELKGGHYLHWTQSQTMAATITAFLNSK
jgi:pimeloyl-ACP methyl ester carboxylesterase